MISGERIFIQIAAYRDPELIPTIRDCIAKAHAPDALRFAIVWQRSIHDEWDTIDEFFTDRRFKFIIVNHDESRGACWARNQTQSFYDGEEYTLQLDSHHRFAEGWDTTCKNMIKSLQAKGHPKPLLTAYLPSYDPDIDPDGRVQDVWQLNLDRFTPEGVVFMSPSIMQDWKSRELPIPTRFLSAHFLFTLGQWNKEVPYDPHLYFHGEEITLAVRSFTSGYDLFIPNKIVAWHEYTRRNRTKHWDDHKDWGRLNEFSIRRVKALLGIDNYMSTEDFTVYGLGRQRSLKDYERFAGIRFIDRAIQQYTLDYKDAPNPQYVSEEAYNASFVHIFKHCINIWKSAMPEEEMMEYENWAIIFEDENGKEIARHDADRKEIDQILENSKNEQWLMIWRAFTGYPKVPYKWIVWPYGKKGWGTRIEDKLLVYN